jgi:hypothetical protein
MSAGAFRVTVDSAVSAGFLPFDFVCCSLLATAVLDLGTLLSQFGGEDMLSEILAISFAWRHSSSRVLSSSWQASFVQQPSHR